MTNLFIIDTEATGKSPINSLMPNFGVVHFDTRRWFYGHLYDFTFHPDNPALPVVPAGATPSPRIATGTETYHDSAQVPLGTIADVLNALTMWLRDINDKPTFVSDNPGWDNMWLACEYDRAGLDYPFGFSSRRIGDLASGLAGNWRATSNWKRYRRTRHDHNPVNDALGNAEALTTVLHKHHQKF